MLGLWSDFKIGLRPNRRPGEIFQTEPQTKVVGSIHPILTNVDNILTKNSIEKIQPPDKTKVYHKNITIINSVQNIESTARIIINDEYDTPETSDTSSDELSGMNHLSKSNTNYDSDYDDDIMNPDFEDDDDNDESTYINNNQQTYK